MDDDKDSQTPAQNQNNEQSVRPDNSKGYNQYIDPDYQNKQKKKKIMLFAAATVVVLAIITTVAVAVLSSSSNDNTNQTVQTAEVCDDTACFEINFLDCKPSELTFEEENSKVRYEITEQGELGCITDIEFQESGYLPEATGKKMTCDLDNTIDLQAAIQNTFDYPDDYDCEGELAEVFKELNSQNES